MDDELSQKKQEFKGGKKGTRGGRKGRKKRNRQGGDGKKEGGNKVSSLSFIYVAL